MDLQIPISPAQKWQRNIQFLASKPPLSWLTPWLLPWLDRELLRLSGGRINLTTIFTGLPVVILTTTGAKSGLPRHSPLVALQDGKRVALIASNFGSRRHPAWAHNLRRNPQAILSHAGRSAHFLAREAAGGERQLYWDRAVRLYAGYQVYEQRARGRKIPVFVLSPYKNENERSQKNRAEPMEALDEYPG